MKAGGKITGVGLATLSLSLPSHKGLGGGAGIGWHQPQALENYSLLGAWRALAFALAILLAFPLAVSAALTGNQGPTKPRLCVRQLAATDAVQASARRQGSSSSLASILEALDGQVIHQIQQRNKFELVARSDLRQVLKEQDLSSAASSDFGADDGGGNAIASCEFTLVVTIDQFSDSTVSRAFEGGTVVDSRRTLTLSAVGKIYRRDGTLLESIDFTEGTANLSSSAPGTGGGGGGGLGEGAVGKLANVIAQRSMEVIFPARVIAYSNGVVTINRGSGTGIKPGQIWDVRALGEALIDPDTGETLGQEETLIGWVKVIEILPKASRAEVLVDNGIDRGQLMRSHPEGLPKGTRITGPAKLSAPPPRPVQVAVAPVQVPSIPLPEVVVPPLDALPKVDRAPMPGQQDGELRVSQSWTQWFLAKLNKMLGRTESSPEPTTGVAAAPLPEQGAVASAPAVAPPVVAPTAAGPLRLAIFVKNRAGSVPDEKVMVFEDLVTARATDRGFQVINREDVAGGIQQFSSTGANAGQGVGPTDLDRELSQSTSALRLASNLGADLLLLASIASFDVESRNFRDDDIDVAFEVDQATLEVTYRVTDGRSGGTLAADSIRVTDQTRRSANLTGNSDPLNRLLSQAAQRIAASLEQRHDVIEASASRGEEATVPIRVAATMGDVTVPEIVKDKAGNYDVRQGRYQIEILAVDVEVDGMMIGSTTPGGKEFQIAPGVHTLRLRRDGFRAVERTFNAKPNLEMVIPLQLDEQGFGRWQEQTRFLSDLKTGERMKDSFSGLLDGVATFFKSFGVQPMSGPEKDAGGFW